LLPSSPCPRYNPSRPTRRSSDLTSTSHMRQSGRLLAFAPVKRAIARPECQRSLGFREVHARQPKSIAANAYTTGNASFPALPARSEEHTSELQSRENLVCRLLLE